MSSIQNLTNSNSWQQQPTTSASSPAGAGTDAQTVTNQLDAAGNGQSWGPAFDEAVQAAGIGNAVANNAGIVTGSNIPQPFAGLDAQQQQSAKDQIWNALAGSADQQQIWNDLYQANLIPDTGTQATITSGANSSGASISAANSSSANISGTGPLPGPTGIANTSSTLATTGVAAASANTGAFTPATLYGYITQSLQQDGVHPNDLSGPGNMGKWDPSNPQGAANLQSFYNGIVGAHQQFYPNMPMDQFARWVVAESAAESTLQPDGGGNGDGVIQANGSVRGDYQQYGVPLVDGAGNTIATPGTTPDSTNPDTCVMLWAWRTSSALRHGGNGPAQWSQNVAQTQSPHFGNTLSVWLDGPGSPGFYQNGSLDTSGFYANRVQQFFTKAGGSADEFQQIAGMPVG